MQSALVYEISWVFMVQDFLLLVGADVGVDLLSVNHKDLLSIILSNYITKHLNQVLLKRYVDT